MEPRSCQLTTVPAKAKLKFFCNNCNAIRFNFYFIAMVNIRCSKDSQGTRLIVDG